MSKIKLYLLLLCFSIVLHVYFLYEAHQFPEQYNFKKVFVVANIVSVTKNSAKQQSFIAKITEICLENQCDKISKKILLSNYWPKQKILQGQQWYLKVKLKPWHGYANPGSFDSELWALLHGFSAKGYIIHDKANHKVQEAGAYGLSTFRNHIANKIKHATNNKPIVCEIILALVLGDKSSMKVALKEVLQKTGTSHLLAISGLHIGLISGFAFFIVLWFWRFSVRLCLWLPAKKAAAITAILMAFFYAALTGFAISALRAFVMITFGLVGIIFDKKILTWRIFTLTLLITVMIDPLAIFNISFWLSYLAVFFILYALLGRYAYSKWFSYWKMQFFITIGLMPILYYYFGQSSSIGLITNLFAIPLVSFLILPISFVASLLPVDIISQWLFNIDAHVIYILIFLLDYFAKLTFSVIHISIPNLIIALLTFIGCLILLSPLTLRINMLAVFFFLPLLFYKQEHLKPGELTINVLDVGQGLSVTVSTANHHLVYDLGPMFPNGNSATRGVVIPFLKQQKIQHIDKLIISHQDSDHVGDFSYFLQQYPMAELTSSAIKKLSRYSKLNYCHAGQHWQWDTINFVMLGPLKYNKLGNNQQSCVLKISNANHSVLLTGDITKVEEEELLMRYGVKLHADILLLAHHGSKTSSSLSFLKVVNPQYAIVSAGFANRYHLPSKQVLDLCHSLGVKVLETSSSGLISVHFLAEKSISISQYRYNSLKFWYHKWLKNEATGQQWH